MKRYGYLWDHIISFENLLLAFKKARKGKRSRDSVGRFEFALEQNLFALQHELTHKTYHPSEYRLFTIYERKPRLISAAPFRDRVVHHALMNVVEPLLDKRLINDCYACRKGKGVHQAVNRYQQWSRQYEYVLKLDISRYFPSIDHQICMDVIGRHIKDPSVLWLFQSIINSCPEYKGERVHYFEGDDLLTPIERQKGLPIGNLTSQFLANLYLNEFDHFVKHVLKAKAYMRYVDDMVLLTNDKQQANDWLVAIKHKLAESRLVLHPHKIRLFRVTQGVDILGYRVFSGIKRLRNDNGYRFERNLKKFTHQYATGEQTWEDFNPSVQSWIGHSSQADTEPLRLSIFNRNLFYRA